LGGSTCYEIYSCSCTFGCCGITSVWRSTNCVSWSGRIISRGASGSGLRRRPISWGRMDHAIGMAPVPIREVSTGGQGTTAGAVRTVLVTAGSLKVPSKRTRADRACASPILSRAVRLLDLSPCTDLRRREAGCSEPDCQIFKTHFDTKDGGRRNTDGAQRKEVKRSGTMFMAFMFVFLAAFSLYYVFDM